MPELSPERWQVVSPYLDRALELDGGERTTWLASLRAEDATLADEVQALLDERSVLSREGFLEGRAAATVSGGSLAGQALGAYTLESQIGQGGMGSVWLVRRSDGRFEGQAAVKLLNPSLVGRAGEERFKREGRILARLTHPHIAHLIDAGVSAAGQPYIVLEHVEGKNIDRYCDAKGLGIEARIKLFLDVTSAVTHAHAHLIVHHDIKPPNVLVRTDGQVKLLDFGIAKLLEPESPSGEATALTQEGGAVLTPEFAAPEQVTGGQVTTATDVHALGVLLYVLLSGRHPTGEGSRTPVELLKAIVGTEPLRMSEAAATGTQVEALAQNARRRATTPEKLRRLLRGDLDTIVAKALKKDPQGRYASVGALADDVRRYLNHEPIGARPDTLAYRAAKFVRRHRPVAASAAMAVVLVAATVVSTQQMLETRRQRKQAEFQARRAQASSEFMRSLVTEIGTTPMTMKEVLDRGVLTLEQQYGDDQAFVARMLVQLSGPYVDLGEFEKAAAMMARALEIATRLDNADLLAATHCGAGDDAVSRRDLVAARTHLSEGLRHVTRLKAPSPGLLVECAVGETRLAGAEGRFDDAIGHATRGVTLLEQAGNTLSTRYTSALNNLGNAYSQAGRHREAIRVRRKTTEVSKQIGRGRTSSFVAHLHNQGMSERALGWWLMAERTILQAMEIARGHDRSGQVPPALSLNYARLLIAFGRVGEGSEWLRRTLEQAEASSRFAIVARLAMASARLDQGDLAGARAGLQQAERDLGHSPLSSDRVALAQLRARVALAEGRLEEARHHLAEGLRGEGYPARLSPSVNELLECASRLAIEARDLEEAIRLAADAVKACELHFGVEEASAHTGRARLTLGLALAADGRNAEARAELERATALIAQAAGADHPWVREARAKLAQLAPG
jgi:serine/threonine-protein kinase